MTASKHQTDFLESYAVWRITYQSSEQAARAAYARVQELEAQRIADWKTGQPDYRTVPQAQWREAEDAASKYRMEADSLRGQLADLTRKSMKRIIELESQLEAIGAGGVEPLRRRECLHHIAPQQEAQKPYAYAVYFPDQPTVELVHDLDELTDDLTNREHQITKLYAAPQAEPAAQGDVEDAAPSQKEGL